MNCLKVGVFTRLILMKVSYYFTKKIPGNISNHTRIHVFRIKPHQNITIFQTLLGHTSGVLTHTQVTEVTHTLPLPGGGGGGREHVSWPHQVRQDSHGHFRPSPPPHARLSGTHPEPRVHQVKHTHFFVFVCLTWCITIWTYLTWTDLTYLNWMNGHTRRWSECVN